MKENDYWLGYEHGHADNQHQQYNYNTKRGNAGTVIGKMIVTLLAFILKALAYVIYHIIKGSYDLLKWAILALFTRL